MGSGGVALDFALYPCVVIQTTPFLLRSDRAEGEGPSRSKLAHGIGPSRRHLAYAQHLLGANGVTDGWLNREKIPAYLRRVRSHGPNDAMMNR